MTYYGGVRRFDEGATRMDELDYELWHACAGSLTSLPPVETLVMYWPQGHIEQVVACTPDSASAADIFEASKHFKLPPHLLCKISKIELQADPQTDDVFAQINLIPQDESLVTKKMKEAPPPSKQNNVRRFCKTLTASDTSTHGGFSVPRRAAEDCLPLLDYNMIPPCQELVAKDLHGKEWNFRHIYRGHPRRHLLTTGWSVFVSHKRLVAGDTVIFLRGENRQLRVGVRRASKQLPIARSIFFSSANLHLGVLAVASHAVSEMIRFRVIYNPRCSGIIVEDDVDSLKWLKLAWRSMKVEWDKSRASEKHERVSPWEMEPFVSISTLFPPSVGSKHKRRFLTPVTDLSLLGTSQSALDFF